MGEKIIDIYIYTYTVCLLHILIFRNEINGCILPILIGNGWKWDTQFMATYGMTNHERVAGSPMLRQSHVLLNVSKVSWRL